MHQQVVFGDQQCQPAIIRRYPQSITHISDQFQASLFVADVFWPVLRWRRAFTEVVNQGSKPDLAVSAQPGGLLEHQKGVYTGVAFGVVGLGLGHTE